MATEKQIAANRRNAALSTGPKTDEGKAQSRANAMTHSLTAVTLMPRDRNISITPVRATRVRFGAKGARRPNTGTRPGVQTTALSGLGGGKAGAFLAAVSAAFWLI